MATPIILYGANGTPLVVVGTSHGEVLITRTEWQHHGHFKAQKILSGDGTQTVEFLTPDSRGSLHVLDLMISFEKKSSAEVSINFHDGTNAELIWFGDMQDAPISFGVTFSSRWQGWRDAHIDIVVAGAGLDGSVAMGYHKVAKKYTLDYAAWNSMR